jgi:hypothetical protein
MRVFLEAKIIVPRRFVGVFFGHAANMPLAGRWR